MTDALSPPNSEKPRPRKRGASRKREIPAAHAVFAAEIQRSAERKALARLPELAQRAALAAMHLEKASLAQMIKAIEAARSQDAWVNAWETQNVDTYLMIIRVYARGLRRSDVCPCAEVVSLNAYRAAKDAKEPRQ